MKITQSFIKAMRGYLVGKTCGNLIDHQYVNGQLLPPSKAMKVGTYFEFCLTGAIPKDGQIPQPEMMKSGRDMMEPYRKARNDADYVKKIIEATGFKILRSGVKLDKGNYTGTIDIIAETTRDITIDGVTIKKGEQVVIDLKYSGLLDDQWNELGWMFTDKQKEYYKTQAVQYHFISGMKFFYLVTDSKHKEKDDETGEPLSPSIKFVYTPVDNFMIEQHILEGNDLMEKFELHKSIGFKALPEFNRCNDCPLYETCQDKALIPTIQIVNLNVD